ncbi:mastermind-like protein 1 isoform X2 [Myripristis murdjan]|uniref:mastermind-like protein 1 isoform X2 n=1 Tax=Myripristis murdjan TaxID=586833 RepID=UPI001175E83C|nr:mastermind-like protein 1 isoform X2 [Myripristis murdjan]
MMADFVAPRHSAVMERLRRRIELFRRHHNSCESRYESTALERLELERQQTFALHQRCLQTKAKRSSKHRQPQPSADPAGQRALGTGSGAAEPGDSGGAAGEQSRNSTLIALQETVKRKLESAGSPLGRDQVNGFSDGFPPSKKSCLDNGTANGSPLDSKLGISDALASNGTHGPAGESADGVGEQEFRLKELKQEPDDILPCMLPAGGGANNSLFPDLNLNEQEWTELMEELNRSVAYEDIQDILNDGFEDRKDPPDLVPTPGGVTAGGGPGGPAGGGGGPQVASGQSSQGLLPPDLANVKTEFSPASVAFDQDSRTGSPHVRPTSSGPPPLPTSSPVASSSASSPALPQSQPAPPSRQLQPPNHLLPPGPPVPKDLSPAQQLQQLAAQQQRAQHLHSQLQHKQQQQGAKFHPQGPHPHPPPWPQTANPSQSPLGGAFGMDKPTSPSLYPQDFNPNNPKQLLMPGQPNKGSPKAGAGPYMQGPGGHPNMLGHPASGPPLSHPPAPGAQAPSSMLNFNNTKPLSHFEAGGPGPGPPRPPNAQTQNKAALLSLLRQQQMKQKNSMTFRPHIPHTQDQSSYPAPPHGPGTANTMAAAPGGNAMAAQPGGNAMAGNHGNAAYMAAALKQQQQHQQQQQQMQILEQQKQQQQYLQRQQLMAEQEKQRQQDQQLQRHLTRPPPQYQDQQGQPANQNPFPQPQVNQFTASSQPMGSVGSMGGPAPGTQRMFPQNQGLMGMNMGQGGGPAGGVAPPPAVSQADMSLPSCGGGGAGVDVQQVLYNNMNLHPNHPNMPGHAPQQGSLQRQPLGPMSATYRQNLLAQQQHLKTQPNAAMLKQQQLAATRMPAAMQNNMGTNLPSSMPGGMQGTQAAAWPQALSNQTPPNTTGLPPNAFNNPPNPFHMQQPRIPKMPPGAAPFGTNPSGRPLGGLNPGQQMMQANMAAAQQRAPPNAQPLGQPLANQQQTQQQANQNQAVLPDLAAFGQPQGNGRQGLQCNQGYQVSRTANQQQQQLSFGYNAASGSFPGESELVDSLLKGQSTQEWMDDLDELLASHH